MVNRTYSPCQVVYGESKILTAVGWEVHVPAVYYLAYLQGGWLMCGVVAVDDGLDMLLMPGECDHVEIQSFNIIPRRRLR